MPKKRRHAPVSAPGVAAWQLLRRKQGTRQGRPRNLQAWQAAIGAAPLERIPKRRSDLKLGGLKIIDGN